MGARGEGDEYPEIQADLLVVPTSSRLEGKP